VVTDHEVDRGRTGASDAASGAAEATASTPDLQVLVVEGDEEPLTRA
jgi:hypothetical protein